MKLELKVNSDEFDFITVFLLFVVYWFYVSRIFLDIKQLRATSD